MKRNDTKNRRALDAATQCALALAILAILVSPPTRTAFADEREDNRVVFFSIPVAVDVAPVYAGASSDSYRTGAVLKDRYVEAYFRPNQEFCAIRPPQGSFSWVNGKFVEETGENAGKIVSPNGKAIPSRVGCDSPLKSSVVQVGLSNGQSVKILGKIGLSDGSTWYKIAPPPGEFRWIKTSSLTRDGAVESLPPRLMFQSEFFALLEREAKSVQKNNSAPATSGEEDDIELTLPDLDDNAQPENAGVDFDSEDESLENVVVDPSAFKFEIARLNADVFQALKRTPLNEDELKSLELRAENLFDSAPDDETRHIVQDAYTALKKAEKESKTSLNPPSPAPRPPRPPQNALQNPLGAAGPNVAIQSFQSAKPNLRWVQATDENGVQRQLLVDQNGVAVSPINGAPLIQTPQIAHSNVKDAGTKGKTPGILPPGYVSSANPQSARPSEKPRKMSFAFSDKNSPFGSNPKNARVSTSGDLSRSDANLTRLPSLFPTARVIVPPQDYDVVPETQNRRNEKLVARTRQKKASTNVDLGETTKETLVAKVQPPTERKSTGEVEFQEPQIAKNDSPTAAPQWRASSEEKGNANKVAPASASEKVGANKDKVKQTNSFAPVTIKTKKGFDAEGVLIATSRQGDGAPRFALLDASGGDFSAVAYLSASQGVALERFVGKKVGVKGDVGTVKVNDKTFKLVVVKSVFPE